MKQDKFEEVKIKMVMRLKKLSRRAAAAEIAAGDVFRTASSQVSRKCDEADLMSAEEFFGEE